MKIGVDIDGTLIDNLSALVSVVNEGTGKRLKEDEIWDFDLSLVYDHPVEEVVKMYESQPERVFFEPPPLPFAREAMEAAKRAGIEVVLVTARNPAFEDITRRWLKVHSIPYDELYFQGNKAVACKRYNLSLFVDDHIRNAKAVSESGIPAVVVDAPHNRHHATGGILYRMWHWDTFPRLLGHLFPERLRETAM